MEGQVQELIMISGKPRDQCIQALRAAYGDPNRAFEYLMTGIPSNAGGAGGAPGGGSSQAQQDYGNEYGDEDGGAPGGGAAMQGNPFASLASNPNF